MSASSHAVPSLLVLLFLAGACAARAPREEGAGGRSVSGSATTRYRGRSGLGASDQDLREVVALDWRGRAPSGPSAHVLGELDWDLDGPDADDEFAFYSLQDTYDHRLTGRLLHAYLDLPRGKVLETVRLGRQ